MTKIEAAVSAGIAMENGKTAKALLLDAQNRARNIWMSCGMDIFELFDRLTLVLLLRIYEPELSLKQLSTIYTRRVESDLIEIFGCKPNGTE